MTTVKFFRQGKIIKGFLAQDHTGFAPHGEDIVCAAVSALTQTAILGLTEVVDVPVQVEIDDGYLRCMLVDQPGEQDDQDSQIVLNTLYKGIQAICAEYGDFVKIEEVESCA